MAYPLICHIFLSHIWALLILFKCLCRDCYTGACSSTTAVRPSATFTGVDPIDRQDRRSSTRGRLDATAASISSAFQPAQSLLRDPRTAAMTLVLPPRSGLWESVSSA